jgi:hypothetical protein
MAASGALLSAAGSTAVQKATTGSVDWARVGTDAAVGAVSGKVGGAAGAGVARLATTSGGLTTVGSAAGVGAVGSLASGMTTRALTGANPFDAQGMATDLLIGTATGGISGHLGAQPQTVTLYRNVDAVEFDSIATTGRFGSGPGSLEGKWFAFSGEHADRWGELLNRGEGLTVQRTVPRNLVDQFQPQYEKLDGVGPAAYAARAQVDEINDLEGEIELWR